MKSLLTDRIRLAREGAAVERCHAFPHHGRYSVGHHSLNMVTMITLAWQEDHSGEFPSPRLLVAAAFHDVPEIITGDIPSDVKHLMPGVEKVDRAATVWLGVGAHLTDEEQSYLHGADKLELWLWCWDQRAMGCINFMDWVREYNLRWTVTPLPGSLHTIWLAAQARLGLPPLSTIERHTAGGLNATR